VYDFDGLTVCHLGDLGHTLSQRDVEMLDEVNVLLVPVGGRSTLGAARAAEVIGLLEPNVVIPMHYQTEGLERNLTSVSPFLKAMGVGHVEPQETFKITSSRLPEGPQVVLLEPRQ
jgi:L-ascorbate metabolism protein UlaG (beta-lactamase superfamily)